MPEHSFDVELAQEFGVNAAILFKNICFWIEKNRANGKNFFDGDYWTYNSKRAFAIMFPYMSERQVGTALQKLIDARMIKTGNYNEDKRDKTMWYALDINGACIIQKCNSHLTKVHNGDDENVRPLPDNKTAYIKTDINTDNIQSASRPEYYNNGKECTRAGKKKEETPKQERFIIPPTIDMVRAYCQERNNTIDPEQFCDYYTAGGWTIGKRKMIDWQATIRTWEKRDAQKRNQSSDAFSEVLHREMERIGGKP